MNTMSNPERKYSTAAAASVQGGPKVADIPESELPSHIFDLPEEIRKAQRVMARRGDPQWAIQSGNTLIANIKASPLNLISRQGCLSTAARIRADLEINEKLLSRAEERRMKRPQPEVAVPPAGAATHRSSLTDCHTLEPPATEDETAAEAQQLLGPDDCQAQALFAPVNGNDIRQLQIHCAYKDVTPRQAATTLRRLAENGQVRWVCEPDCQQCRN